MPITSITFMFYPLFYFYKKHRRDKGRLKVNNYTEIVSRIGYSAPLHPVGETSSLRISNQPMDYMMFFTISNDFVMRTNKCAHKKRPVWGVFFIYMHQMISPPDSFLYTHCPMPHMPPVSVLLLTHRPVCN